MELFECSPFVILETFFVVCAFLGIFGLPILRVALHNTYIVRKGRKLGPTYWGFYSDSSSSDAPEHITIEVKRPTFAEVIVAGGTSYSSGKAVKGASAR